MRTLAKVLCGLSSAAISSRTRSEALSASGEVCNEPDAPPLPILVPLQGYAVSAVSCCPCAPWRPCSRHVPVGESDEANEAQGEQCVTELGRIDRIGGHSAARRTVDASSTR